MPKRSEAFEVETLELDLRRVRAHAELVWRAVLFTRTGPVADIEAAS